MRLVNKDLLIKAIDEGSISTSEDIEGMPEEKAIPITWLHKTLIDLMYDGKAKEDALHVFHAIIARWEKENV